MKTETRKIYNCEYCSKYYKLAHFCEYHERLCKKNPDNQRVCYGCGYLSKRKLEVESRYETLDTSDNIQIVSTLFCSKLNVMMHTPQNAVRGHRFESDAYDNIQMLTECEHWKPEEWLEPQGSHVS